MLPGLTLGGFLSGSALMLGFGVPMAIGGGAMLVAGGGFGAVFATIGSFFGALGGIILAAVGLPIIISFFGMTLFVSLTLLIINSGAYVVPLGNSFGSGSISDIQCDSNQSNATANAAVCIVKYLDQFHLNPLLAGLVGSPAWKSLQGVLNSAAIDALGRSAIGNSWLQCVGFTSATAGQAYGQNFAQINACSYINNPPSGYRYVSGTNGMKAGDFFVMNGSKGCATGSPGHIGVVLSVDGAVISCADANYIGSGRARVAHGCFALSQIAGYLRK